MTNNQTTNSKYNLEPRTLIFAKTIIHLCEKLPRNNINSNLITQIIRSSGSIGANYREANDSLGRKDFINKIKISRKEAKETIYWLELITEANTNFQTESNSLIKECEELKKIFSSIINKFVSS